MSICVQAHLQNKSQEIPES